MKNFNKEEYNKLCAEFLGGVLSEMEAPLNPQWFGLPFEKRGIPEGLLKFDFDWNWIMEVVEKIEDGLKLHTVTSQGMTGHYININRGVSVAHSSLSNPSKFMGTGKTKKEAVIRAIWEFLDWYNQQEK